MFILIIFPGDPGIFLPLSTNLFINLESQRYNVLMCQGFSIREIVSQLCVGTEPHFHGELELIDYNSWGDSGTVVLPLLKCLLVSEFI